MKTTSKFNNDLPMKKIQVVANYDNLKAVVNPKENIDFQNMNLFSKENHAKRIETLVVGDYIEIYYSDETYSDIDHILVDEAEMLTIEVVKRSIPGDLYHNIDLVPDNNIDLAIRHESVSYVLNQDGSYTHKNDLADGTIIYGVYQEEEITYQATNQVLYLIALYSYNPRTK